LSQALTRRLAGLAVSPLHDVMRKLGHQACVLPMAIRGVDPAMRVAGEAWTVEGHVDRTLDPDLTLLEWTRLLSRAPRGKVLVLQPHTRDIALMGELSAKALAMKGVRGFVVEAPCRDVAEVAALGFPVFAAGATPSDITGRWVAHAFGRPIDIGGVTIASGDFVAGDRDGVVAIPRALAKRVVAETERVMGTEGAVRKAILGGMDPYKAYLKHRKF